MGNCCEEHAEDLRVSQQPDWLASRLAKLQRLDKCIERLREEKAELSDDVDELRRQAGNLSGQLHLPSCIAEDQPLPGAGVIADASVSADDDFPGIYFLLLDSQIVYVGQATNMLARLRDHKNAKEKHFNRVSFLPCRREALDFLEAYYIRQLSPPLNRAHPSLEWAEYQYRRRQNQR